MRQSVRLVVVTLALLFPAVASAESQPAGVPVTAPVSAGNPMAEQATMALVLGGLAAALKRRKPGVGRASKRRA